jgi:iron complex transport system permease protein
MFNSPVNARPLPKLQALSRVRGKAAVLLLMLLVMLGLSLRMGAIALSTERVLAALLHPASAPASDVTILWNLRLPRTLLAAMTGAALAAAGAAFQGLFRNPLADPFIIGASSGAAFGATLALMFGFSSSLLGLGPVPIAAFAGALMTVFVVYALAGSGSAPVGALLLCGSAVGTLLSAVVSFLLISKEQPWFTVFSWLLGGFSGRSWNHVWAAAPYLGVGISLLWAAARPLDALAGGDEAARSLGLNVGWARILIVAAASLVTAASVAVAGTVGFVGLIAPHMARLLFGGGHARLIPMSAVLGAILLVAADNVARTVLAPNEVPVGIITAALGGPFFLYLLRTRGFATGPA